MSTINQLNITGELRGTLEDTLSKGRYLPQHSGLSCCWAVGSESLIKALTQRNVGPNI